MFANTIFIYLIYFISNIFCIDVSLCDNKYIKYNITNNQVSSLYDLECRIDCENNPIDNENNPIDNENNPKMESKELDHTHLDMHSIFPCNGTITQYIFARYGDIIGILTFLNQEDIEFRKVKEALSNLHSKMTEDKMPMDVSKVFEGLKSYIKEDNKGELTGDHFNELLVNKMQDVFLYFDVQSLVDTEEVENGVVEIKVVIIDKEGDEEEVKVKVKVENNKVKEIIE
ncbi:hypothetical protein EHP00_1967 [Ecytonucleospora hepatopenaei]|uniref:Uncharacterized protein n=1 Tax=Ecytonucleospora hepatopenaei TaxID=646526 RepID=A0A1W0E2A7_9MICR|nr:hypothetical protein EHP00_1967 [Ecytonucleospora hepatopenaei]